jgi:hypothetical protein
MSVEGGQNRFSRERDGFHANGGSSAVADLPCAGTHVPLSCVVVISRQRDNALAYVMPVAQEITRKTYMSSPCLETTRKN